MKIPTVLITATVLLSACQATEPVVRKATPNLISISYNAYGSTPTLTPEALDQAIEHCKSQGGRYANYRGVSVPNALSTEEVHTFVCERQKTDDSAVIEAQNRMYMESAAAAAAIMQSSVVQPNPIYVAPVRTRCTTIGYQTNCTSY
jgi:hypothetical protein